MTIEDPVEYVFPVVNQMHINPQADVTFANGLRSPKAYARWALKRWRSSPPT
jgi:Tfp pilus assembly pilus retraction ATPase PilT